MLEFLSENEVENIQVAANAFSEAEIQSLNGLGFEPVIQSDRPTRPAPGAFVYPLRDSVDDDSVLRADGMQIAMIVSDAF